MPISYSYNSNKGYVEVLVIGLTSDTEIMEARINYLSDSSWIPGAPEFIDLSEANFENVSPSGLQKISSFSNQVFKSTEVTTVKIAVYAPDIVPSIMLSLYGDMSKETVENVNPTTQHSVQHLPFPVAFSCETNKNGDYAAGSSLLIQ